VRHLAQLGLGVIALLFAPACEEMDSGGGPDGNTGKQDDADGSAQECSLDDDDPRTFVQFVNNDTVQFRCRGADGKFVDTGCCEEQIDEFTFATGCPPQAKFNSASGANKRCVEDHPDAAENLAGEPFVASVCCELLCDDRAKWDDPKTQQTCRNSKGQFHPHVCCMMNDDARCGDATFDQNADVNGLVHCRARSGQFAGQFAPAACCLDSCTEMVEQGVDALPLECVLPLEEECAGADVDDAGLCRTTDGRFAKAACCMGIDGLKIPESDECRYAELVGDDLTEAGCE
jgi:hypothetical protein